MESNVRQYSEDFRRLTDAAARAAGFSDPVAFDADDFENHLLKASRRGRFAPIDGAFIRDWDRDYRQTWPGMNIGLRLYHYEAMSFVRVYASYVLSGSCCGYDFLVCDRSDYLALYRASVRVKRKAKPPLPPPVMPADTERALWLNTIEF